MENSHNEDHFGEFTYVAFDQKSETPLAFGRRAIDALKCADIAGPNMTIQILKALGAGGYIWEHKIPLSDAKILLGEKRLG
ncbi:MAG: hypothetical protein B7Y73_02990 [Acidocella sp. 35-58-6]|nr:MAG: hypothetical protein B7Y73_02990 [Acidocella sp. 35-58-6]